MDKVECILGIDTSNYTTSVAFVDMKGTIISDNRKMLQVKKGQRGLRQSEALFQHVKNLPEVCRKPASNIDIVAVAASEKPRPVEGSYMPCFLPGENFGKSMAQLLKIPYFGFSHQEGHIEALIQESGFSREKGFLSFHLSGGTCELLKMGAEEQEIVGGSLDISFGQLLDRVGVALEMNFPAGAEMDERAFALMKKIESNGRNFKATNGEFDELTKIKCKDGWINLSGSESEIMRLIDQNPEIRRNNERKDALFLKILKMTAKSIVDICQEGTKKTGIEDVMLVGGVSSSKTIKTYIEKNSKNRIWIGNSDKGRDNAVGIALLGRKAYGNKTC